MFCHFVFHYNQSGSERPMFSFEHIYFPRGQDALANMTENREDCLLMYFSKKPMVKLHKC